MMYEAPGYANQGFHVFLATGLEEGKQELEVAEAGLTVQKLSPYELQKYIADGGITDSPSVAAFALLISKRIVTM